MVVSCSREYISVSTWYGNCFVVGGRPEDRWNWYLRFGCLCEAKSPYRDLENMSATSTHISNTVCIVNSSLNFSLQHLSMLWILEAQASDAPDGPNIVRDGIARAWLAGFLRGFWARPIFLRSRSASRCVQLASPSFASPASLPLFPSLSSHARYAFYSSSKHGGPDQNDIDFFVLILSYVPALSPGDVTRVLRICTAEISRNGFYSQRSPACLDFSCRRRCRRPWDPVSQRRLVVGWVTPSLRRLTPTFRVERYPLLLKGKRITAMRLLCCPSDSPHTITLSVYHLNGMLTLLSYAQLHLRPTSSPGIVKSLLTPSSLYSKCGCCFCRILSSMCRFHVITCVFNRSFHVDTYVCYWFFHVLHRCGHFSCRCSIWDVVNFILDRRLLIACHPHTDIHFYSLANSDVNVLSGPIGVVAIQVRNIDVPVSSCYFKFYYVFDLPIPAF